MCGSRTRLRRIDAVVAAPVGDQHRFVVAHLDEARRVPRGVQSRPSGLRSHHERCLVDEGLVVVGMEVDLLGERSLHRRPVERVELVLRRIGA
jgi:hypothetical protein